MSRKYYNKLIRDKIPAKIVQSGGDYQIKKLARKEYEKELIKKVHEEASGLLVAKTKKELIAELADVMDVIDEVKAFKNISSKQVRAQQQKNKKLKGGFKNRIFLYWSSDTGYKTNEISYKR